MAPPSDPRLIRAQLARWINDVPSVYVDIAAQKRLITEAYGMLDRNGAGAQVLNDWFAHNKGLQEGYVETTDDCRAILSRLGDHAPAHLDLAGAYYRDGELELVMVESTILTS